MKLPEKTTSLFKIIYDNLRLLLYGKLYTLVQVKQLPFVSNIGKQVINNRIKLNTEITNPPIINTTKTKISVGANS